MARDFDGSGDNINFGSDASIDAFTPFTVAMWMRCDNGGSDVALCSKLDGLTAGWLVKISAAAEFVRFFRVYTGGVGEWFTTAGELNDGVRHHFALSHDGNPASSPVVYVDGVTRSVTNDAPTSGTLETEAGGSLIIGEDIIGDADFNGVVEHFAYDNAVWTAAQVNRHRWTGRKGGACVVQHPFYTTKTANEGTGTATATPTGTTVVSFPTPVQRAA